MERATENIPPAEKFAGQAENAHFGSGPLCRDAEIVQTLSDAR